MRSTILTLAAGLALVSASLAQPSAKPAPPTPTPTSPVPPATKPSGTPNRTASAKARLEAILAKLDETQDFRQAHADVAALWDHMVVYFPASETASFREVAQARRMIMQLMLVDKDARGGMLKFLRKSPNLTGALVFQVREGDNIPGVYGTLSKMRGATPTEAHDKLMEKYAGLTAAVCVVHDKPLKRAINEHMTTAPGPSEVFEFFAQSAEKGLLQNKLEAMPAELLLFVVDVTTPIDELKWAQQKYGKDRQVGNRYQDVPYDTDSFELGKPKKIAGQSYTLQNVLKYGGVCADQAYFACAVGKSIGIPTAYVTASDGSVAHAWLGYLRGWGPSAVWNFDTGRYDSYRNVRGNVEDPQAGVPVSDAQLAVSAEAADVDTKLRYEAQAMTDAAMQLAVLVRTSAIGAVKPVEGVPVAANDKTRTGTPSEMLDLLEGGLRKCAAHPRAWEAATNLAKQKMLSTEQRRKLGGMLDELCGRKFADFTVYVMTPVIQSVDDTKEQATMWGNLLRSLQSRHDLMSEVLVREGKMYEKAGNKTKAKAMYDEVIDKYMNSGPSALGALSAVEMMMKDDGDAGMQRVLSMYDKAFKRVQKPGESNPSVVRGSNWFRVGARYMALLDEAGQQQQAAKIGQQLGIKGPKG
ncbi:MAG: hypothetical protein ACREJO_11805 [Phycisphaerales bacterium]